MNRIGVCMWSMIIGVLPIVFVLNRLTDYEANTVEKVLVVILVFYANAIGQLIYSKMLFQKAFEAEERRSEHYRKKYLWSEEKNQ